MTRYPDIEVKLEGMNGVDTIVGRIARALRKQDIPKSEIQEFTEACTDAEDFYGLMSICKSWVSVPDYEDFE